MSSGDNGQVLRALPVDLEDPCPASKDEHRNPDEQAYLCDPHERRAWDG